MWEGNTTEHRTGFISNGVHEDQKALVNDRRIQRVGEEPPQHDGDAPYRVPVRSPVLIDMDLVSTTP